MTVGTIQVSEPDPLVWRPLTTLLPVLYHVNRLLDVAGKLMQASQNQGTLDSISWTLYRSQAGLRPSAAATPELRDFASRLNLWTTASSFAIPPPFHGWFRPLVLKSTVFLAGAA